MAKTQHMENFWITAHNARRPTARAQVSKTKHLGQDNEDVFTAASSQNHTQKQYLSSTNSTWSELCETLNVQLDNHGQQGHMSFTHEMSAAHIET